MPSGRASRGRRISAQVPPRVRSTGPRRRQASPRILAAGGGAIVAIAVVVVIILQVTGGGSSTSLGTVPAVGSIAGGLPEAADVNTLFKGIPQSGTTLGRPTAPVTMVEFIDAQCPYCGQFEAQVVPSLVTKYVRTGKLKITMEPWAFIGPDSTRGQAAELAAAHQNVLFNFTALLYDNQGPENTGWLTDRMIAKIAGSIPGLEVHTLLNARGSAAIKSQQKQIAALASAEKVGGTPTIFVGKSGTQGTEVALQGPTDEQSVVDAITAAAG